MTGGQTLLFPDAKPLVERLGADFFRQLPKRPGVYLMRDHTEAIVYIGKAKNLRQRLGSYRVANPDRVPKRLLRLLKCVVRIDYQECTDENAALAQEASLLRELKPRFNRAGVWPAPAKVLAWKLERDGITLCLQNKAEEGWTCHGPLKGGASIMLASLVRVFWALTCAERGLIGMPAGWFHGRLPETIHLPAQGIQAETWLTALTTQPELTTAAMLSTIAAGHQGWQLELLSQDLESLTLFYRPRR
ncbi:MAG TPA: nucleotide excision repair endonuclease [Verrucomicrobiae bacterium]